MSYGRKEMNNKFEILIAILNEFFYVYLEKFKEMNIVRVKEIFSIASLQERNMSKKRGLDLFPPNIIKIKLKLLSNKELSVLFCQIGRLTKQFSSKQ